MSYLAIARDAACAAAAWALMCVVLAPLKRLALPASIALNAIRHEQREIHRTAVACKRLVVSKAVYLSGHDALLGVVRNVAIAQPWVLVVNDGHVANGLCQIGEHAVSPVENLNRLSRGSGFGPFLLLVGPTSSVLCAPRTAPDLFDLAGYGTQRATLKASMCTTHSF